MNYGRPLIDFKMFDTPDWMRWVIAYRWGQEYVTNRKQVRICCPNPCSSTRPNRSCSVNFELGKFQCFGCKAAGNALTLYSHSTGLPIYYAAVAMCRERGLPVPFVEPFENRGDHKRGSE